MAYVKIKIILLKGKIFNKYSKITLRILHTLEIIDF